MSYQARQTKPETLAALDRLLDTHTDAQAADALNADGHRTGTGQAFTPSIVLHLRRGNSLPSHLNDSAPEYVTIPKLAEGLGVHHLHHQGLGTTPACSSPTKPTTKTCSFQPPAADDPRLVKRMGSRLANALSTDHRLEVHYETYALS